MMKKEIQYKLIWLFLVIGAWGILCFLVIPTLPAWPQSQKSEIAQRNPVEKSSQKKPDLQFEEKIYDFGTVYKGAIVDYKFKFTNKGDGLLMIEKVKPSCGCTAALITANTITPGERGEIKTSVSTKNLQGRISKKIYVYSNDSDEGVIQLVIKGTVIEGIILNSNIKM